MSVEALTSNPSIRAAWAASQAGGTPSPTQLAADRRALATAASPGGTPSASPADVRKAASQFEAIILRQLLEPSLAPIMSGGLAGEGGAGGGGMYAYMLGDVLSTSLAQGGGLGWARLLEKQLSPPQPTADKQA